MRNFLLLSMALALTTLTGLSAQEKSVKKVRVVIDENGTRTDTSFVVSGINDAEVEKMITVIVNDSAGSDCKDKQIKIIQGNGSGMMFITTNDDAPVGGKKNVMVMKKLEGDSMQYTYTIDDAPAHGKTITRQIMVMKGADGKTDTIVLDGEGFLPPPPPGMAAGKDVNREGKNKDVQLFVTADDNASAHAFKVVEGHDLGSMMMHSETGGMVEVKDIPKPNELELKSLHAFGIQKGVLMLNFSTGAAGEMSLKITDNKKKEVFSQKIKNFNGEYHQEVQLGSDASGSYVLTVSQGKKKIQKEISVR